MCPRGCGAHRRLEDVLVEWLDHAAVEPPIDSLPDDEILALCDQEMDAAQQETLSELLTLNREGQLHSPASEQLDELMGIYRRGLVRKAQALKIAVE